MDSVERQGRSGGAQRVLLVHAHPDDETIATGGTIAKLVRHGADVTVLTCTRGEQGEVIPPELKHLEGDGEALASHRTGELADALRVLGVQHHRFLGDPGARSHGLSPRRYLDSGMQWGPEGAEPLPESHPLSLCAADLAEVTEDIVAAIAQAEPHVVISYDETGGYGHPDHVRAHHAAKHAAWACGVPFYAILPQDIEAPAGAVQVDVTDERPAVRSALQAHRTQVTVEGDSFALSSGPYRQLPTTETFVLQQEFPDDSAGQALSPLSWALAGALAVAVGLAAGAIGTVNHQLMITAFGIPIWTGVALSLLIVAAMLVGTRLVFGNRVLAGCLAGGILVAVFWFSGAGPGGSVLLPDNPAGFVWAYGPLVIAGLVLAWPRLPQIDRGTMRGLRNPKGHPSP